MHARPASDAVIGFAITSTRLLAQWAHLSLRKEVQTIGLSCCQGPRQRFYFSLIKLVYIVHKKMEDFSNKGNADLWIRKYGTRLRLSGERSLKAPITVDNGVRITYIALRRVDPWSGINGALPWKDSCDGS